MMLETWILVIEMFAFAVGEPHGSSRTRDLPHDACLTLVQEVKSEKTIAYCYRTGEEDPYLPGYYARPRVKQPICAHGGGSCAWPLLPGRRRVELVPHICGIGHCTPVDDGPGNTRLPRRM